MQKNLNILNSLAAVIHKDKGNVAGNSKKVVHLWSKYSHHSRRGVNGSTHNFDLHL